MTEADVRLRLAEEDGEDAACGRSTLHIITPAGLIMELLDIEEQQYVLLTLGCHITDVATP